MDAKTTLSKIMTYLGMDDEAKVVKVQFETKKIKEGDTEFEAEEFAVGNAVFIKNEDEEKIPAPEGMYEMEDDYKMGVDEKGTIMSYDKKEMEEDEEGEEKKPAEPKEEEQEMNNEDPSRPAKKVVETTTQSREIQFAEVEKMRTDFAEERKAWESEKAEYETKLSDMKSELEELKTRLAEEPSTKGLKHSVEGKREQKHLFKHKSKTRNTIQDRVYSRMVNFNK